MRPSSLLPIQTDPARRFLAADVAGEDAQETLRPPQEEIADPLGRLDFVEAVAAIRTANVTSCSTTAWRTASGRSSSSDE
jgi:hypothetical protein